MHNHVVWPHRLDILKHPLQVVTVSRLSRLTGIDVLLLDDGPELGSFGLAGGPLGRDGIAFGTAPRAGLFLSADAQVAEADWDVAQRQDAISTPGWSSPGAFNGIEGQLFAVGRVLLVVVCW